MRLWLRLTVIMAVVALVPLLVEGRAAIDVTREMAELAPEESSLFEAKVHSEALEAWLDIRTQLLTTFWSSYAFAEAGPERQLALLKGTYQFLPSVVTLVLVDVEGGPVVPPVYLEDAAEGMGRVRGTHVRALALLRALPKLAGQVDGVVVGEPYLPAGAAAPVVPMLVSSPGSSLAMGAEVSLLGMMGRFADTPNRAVTLFDGADAPVFGTDHPLMAGVDTERALEVIDGAMSFRGLPGNADVVGASSPMYTVPWTVLVVKPRRLGGAAAQEIQRQTLKIVLMCGALILVTGVVNLRTISQPLGRLREVVLKVADGQYGLRTSADRLPDEIGELGRAFNHMSTRLAASKQEIDSQQAEIEAFNLELQQRVLDRTQELEAAQRSLVETQQVAAVSEVGASLAHELNNPLAAILGRVQVAMVRGSADAEVLAALEQQALRCREVVAAMVRFSSGEVDPLLAPVVDLAGVMRETVHSAHSAFERRGVALDWSEPHGERPVRMERVFAIRVVSQLLSALCAGLPAGSTLQVELATVPEGQVVILTPPQVVGLAGARDDWKVASMGLWTARRLVQLCGGSFHPPDDTDPAWRVVLPAVA